MHICICHVPRSFGTCSKQPNGVRLGRKSVLYWPINPVKYVLRTICLHIRAHFSPGTEPHLRATKYTSKRVRAWVVKKTLTSFRLEGKNRTVITAIGTGRYGKLAVGNNRKSPDKRPLKPGRDKRFLILFPCIFFKSMCIKNHVCRIHWSQRVIDTIDNDEN